MDWKLELVVVPVSDVDAAKHFYTDQVGFPVDFDHRLAEGLRVVQLTPPGSACSIAIGDGITEAIPGSLQRLQLVVDDVAAAREQLLRGGVEVSGVQHMVDGEWVDGPGGRWNSFIFFDDLDGNGWVVQERPRP